VQSPPRDGKPRSKSEALRKLSLGERPVRWPRSIIVTEGEVMMETREMNRLYMKAANNAAGIIAGYNVKNLQMSRAIALSSFEFMARLAGSKTGLEVIKSSGAHYRNQLDVLRGYTDDLVDLAFKKRSMWQDRSEREGS
jgi:hypothetical protein